MSCLPPLTLVIGGARSGKSAFAEKLVTSTGLSCLYLATATRSDTEMDARIDRHRAERSSIFITLEVPLNLSAALHAAGPDQPLLVDCATLWLSNHLLAGADPDTVTADLLSALAACRAPVVIVSNEVGWGLVPDTPLGRAFRDAQGRLNQRIAAQADTVAGIMAGLPFALKGTLPPGL